jgi:hypothetical protein
MKNKDISDNFLTDFLTNLTKNEYEALEYYLDNILKSSNSFNSEIMNDGLPVYIKALKLLSENLFNVHDKKVGFPKAIQFCNDYIEEHNPTIQKTYLMFMIRRLVFRKPFNSVTIILKNTILQWKESFMFTSKKRI